MEIKTINIKDIKVSEFYAKPLVAQLSRKEELILFVQALCSHRAYKLSGITEFIFNTDTNLLSDDTKTLIKEGGKGKLKQFVINTIIHSTGGEYNSFKLNEHWKRHDLTVIPIPFYWRFFAYYWYEDPSDEIIETAKLIHSIKQDGSKLKFITQGVL